MNLEENKNIADCRTTPPTNKKVRNPFDKALIERLHKPICSPGMFKLYKIQNNGTFRWDIDQACSLLPADIVACNSQFEPSPDPALEKIAEEATEKYFSQEVVIPSPLESTKNVTSLLPPLTDTSLQLSNMFKGHTSIMLRDVSAQTVLTLPPQLPAEVEKALAPYFTYTQDQHLDTDYENGNISLRRKLFFEELSDIELHDDSEHTDDEVHIPEVMEQQPTSYRHEVHTPVVFSPDVSQNLVAKGMKRTFGTPLRKNVSSSKPHNKILDGVDLGEPGFSPIRKVSTPSSLASISISPVTKVASSDEEKNNFTSPESDAAYTCPDCGRAKQNYGDDTAQCNCNTPPNPSIVLKRSNSNKETPPRTRKMSSSLSEKRSSSMSNLNRSRSVQKLDFSMDMSIDGSFHNQSADSESSPPRGTKGVWSIGDDINLHTIVNNSSLKAQTQIISLNQKQNHVDILDETPVKSKNKSNILSHNIIKMRTTSPLHNMSLDSSFDNIENPLNLEDKKVDFNNVDLKFLTENGSQFVTKNDKPYSNNTSSFKRVDSGYNETTFYANSSSYYESAIKPSELTVTHSSNKTALKEISNVNWMRVDSGFNENSGDSMQLFVPNENMKKTFCCGKFDDKENVANEDVDRIFTQSCNKNEAMSMSEIFNEDMTFNCNFSSTPSKNKLRKVQ